MRIIPTASFAAAKPVRLTGSKPTEPSSATHPQMVSGTDTVRFGLFGPKKYTFQITWREKGKTKQERKKMTIPEAKRLRDKGGVSSVKIILGFTENIPRGWPN